MKDLLEGEYTQALINRQLFKSQFLCPSNINFNSSFIAKDLPIGIPITTKTGKELMILSSVVASQTAAAVIAKSFITDSASLVNKDVEDELVNTDLLDLTKLSTTIGS